MHRIYENGDLVVFWDSDKCYHAKRCVTGSPKTFDPTRKPWIDLSKDENARIWQAIEKCPSGALTCQYRHDVDVTMDAEGHRSVARLDGVEIGECEYSVDVSGWNIYHTFVKPEHEGQGIAKRLVFTILEAAERDKTAVTATCSYARKIIGE